MPMPMPLCHCAGAGWRTAAVERDAETQGRSADGAAVLCLPQTPRAWPATTASLASPAASRCPAAARCLPWDAGQEERSNSLLMPWPLLRCFLTCRSTADTSRSAPGAAGSLAYSRSLTI
ncbi:hypothetical protein NDU88_006411 [Pleurodeles waltl]|uniref:Uncharacterized protein n=1 Tax=Pleurodeles waltl TaxID=8319 RepID=A0AAV7TXS7_PLEWA|nr:hypothetical protein NDU88_006411 [Pleurodeles waltl]